MVELINFLGLIQCFEMGIESPLMTDSKGEVFDRFYELPNGCICCSAKKDLQKALEYLLSSEKYELDYILVETNGLADPSSTIKEFWLGEEYEHPAQLELIYSLVAAHAFKKNIKENEIFIRQIINADCILINHTDKVSEEEIKEISDKLNELNPLAKIRTSKHAVIDLDEFFGFEGAIHAKKSADMLLEKKIKDHSHVHASAELNFIVLEYLDKNFELSKLEIAIGTLVWEAPEGMEFLRVKGIINNAESEEIISLQGVDDVFDIQKTDVPWGKRQRKSKFLFIGKNLKKESIDGILLGATI